MDLPEMLPWEVLRARLTRVLMDSPRCELLHNPDPCIQRVIRLRDIADYTGIYRAEIYRVRRGERSLKPDVQKILSWFFFNLDRGRLVKEQQVDGKWRIVPAPSQVHPHAPHARPATLEASVDFLTGKLTLNERRH